MHQQSTLPDQATRRLGIVGSGLMGGGIAQVALQRGFDIVLFDSVEGVAAIRRTAILKSIATAVDRNHVAAADVADAAERISVAASLADLSGVQAVVEAIVEDPDIKNQLFRELETVVADDTLLATNTSAIPITRVAAGLRVPERVIGMHFFSPVPATRLCEIVQGLQTSGRTLDRARRLAQDLGKDSITVSRDDAGFVTSRLMTVLGQEAVRLVEEGLATAEDVDKACMLAFGHRMGPLATLDLTGLDVALRAGDGMHRETANASYAPPQLLRRMVSAGRLGRKSGRGFYEYTEEKQP